MEESALGMEQHGLRRLAATMDAPTKSSREESALGMEQRKNSTTKHAAIKDAPNLPKKEGPASGMGRRLQSTYAVMRDAAIIPGKEESAACSIGQSTKHAVIRMYMHKPCQERKSLH